MHCSAGDTSMVAEVTNSETQRRGVKYVDHQHPATQQCTYNTDIQIEICLPTDTFVFQRIRVSTAIDTLQNRPSTLRHPRRIVFEEEIEVLGCIIVALLEEAKGVDGVVDISRWDSVKRSVAWRRDVDVARLELGWQTVFRRRWVPGLRRRRVSMWPSMSLVWSPRWVASFKQALSEW